MWGIANLRTLDLSHNRIAKLPAKVRGLAPKLKTLALTDNRLSDLPDELCECKELQTLSLGQNSLTSLPDALGALGKLKTLVLAHNRLVALPESMCALQSLQQLDASHNKLRALPAAFGALCMLAHADLSDNELGGEGLPDGLGALAASKSSTCTATHPSSSTHAYRPSFYSTHHFNGSNSTPICSAPMDCCWRMWLALPRRSRHTSPGGRQESTRRCTLRSEAARYISSSENACCRLPWAPTVRLYICVS